MGWIQGSDSTQQPPGSYAEHTQREGLENALPGRYSEGNAAAQGALDRVGKPLPIQVGVLPGGADEPPPMSSWLRRQ